MRAKNLLRAKDIVYMNIIGIVSLRQVPNVAPYGASSVLLWILAAFCFFIPLALVCGELSTRYSQDGGMFVWIKEAFNLKLAWISVVFYLASCIIFFPMLLFFGFSAFSYILPDTFFDLLDKRLFIGLGSMVTFAALTFLNILGIKWTKRINSILMYLGIFLPTLILLFCAIFWVIKGDGMQSDYSFSLHNYLPDFSHFNTIVFASSMMFAFAGLELSSMVAGRIENPNTQFPKAIFLSAIFIVGIYILMTFCINVIYPSSKISILDGFSQATRFVCGYFNIKYLPQVLELCIFLGVLGQINSWLVGPMYMLKVASREPEILGKNLSKLHPKYKTPYIALIYQGVFVCILCMATMISQSIEKVYWAMTSLTTLCYFVPYLIVFPAFVRINKLNLGDDSGFSLKSKKLALFISIIGTLSVVFAIVLTLIPPSTLGSSGLKDVFLHFATMLSGPILALIFALFSCRVKGVENEKL